MVRQGLDGSGRARRGWVRPGSRGRVRSGPVRQGLARRGSHGCVCLVGQGFCWERLDMAVMECIVRVRLGTEVFGSERQSRRGKVGKDEARRGSHGPARQGKARHGKVRNVLDRQYRIVTDGCVLSRNGPEGQSWHGLLGMVVAGSGSLGMTRIVVVRLGLAWLVSQQESGSFVR